MPVQLRHCTHLFTAGHCIKPKDRPEVKAEFIVLFVGKHNLQEWAETNSQAKEVSNWCHWRWHRTTAINCIFKIYSPRITVSHDKILENHLPNSYKSGW